MSGGSPTWLRKTAEVKNTDQIKLTSLGVQISPKINLVSNRRFSDPIRHSPHLPWSPPLHSGAGNRSET